MLVAAGEGRGAEAAPCTGWLPTGQHVGGKALAVLFCTVTLVRVWSVGEGGGPVCRVVETHGYWV